MPNGHGGIPFLGTPVLLAVAFAVLTRVAHPGWPWAAALLWIAALFGWRLAYHLHMRGADEYGGAHMSPEAHQRTRTRYSGIAVAYVLIAVAAAFVILKWRGIVPVMRSG